MKSNVAKNAAWIIICKIVQSLLSLFVSMMTARYLGPANFGMINYAASLVSFFSPMMYLGLNSILVQEIINNPDNEGTILGTSMFMSFLSGIACIVGVISFASIANNGEEETIVVCTLYSILLLFQAADLLQYWFQAKLLSKYTSVAILISYSVVSLYKIFLLYFEKSIYWFSISNALDYFLIAICLLAAYIKRGESPLRVDCKFIPRLLRRSKYYIIANLMVVVFTQTDKVMLKLMLDDYTTGYYSAAVTCAGMASFVYAAIIDSFRPSIFSSKKRSESYFEKSIVELYSVIIWLSILQSVIMTALSHPIIRLLYGDDYLPSIGLLKIVVWYTTFSYLGSVRGVWMLAEEKQRYLLIINLFGALFNVIMNYILIPAYGAAGAAIASFITQFFANFILGYCIKPMQANNGLIIRGANPKVAFSVLRNIWK